MSDKIFIDSNVLIYAYSYSEPEKTEKVWNILKEKDKIAISTQVVGEFVTVLYKKHKVERNLISIAANNLMKILDVKLIYDEIITKALFIFERYKYSYYDSLIIATAFKNDCSILYTEDLQHEQIIEDRLKIVNPFL